MTRHRHDCGHVHECAAPDPVPVVDRPDNGQDECVRKSDAFAEWYSGSRAFMSYQIAFDAGWDAALAYVAGAGEQQRERVEALIRRYNTGKPSWSVAEFADELLALLGGPQPDGEA